MPRESVDGSMDWRFLIRGIVGACCVSAAVAQPEAGPRNALRDLQLGETDALLRIAFVCATPCPVVKRPDGSLILDGVDADIALDLAARSRHVKSIALIAMGRSSRISFDLEAEFGDPEVSRCKADGRAATCLDFTRTDIVLAAAPNGSTAPTTPPPPPRQAAALRAPTELAENTADLPILGAAMTPKPKDWERVAEALAPPTRFGPPAETASDFDEAASEAAPALDSDEATEENVAEKPEALLVQPPTLAAREAEPRVETPAAAAAPAQLASFDPPSPPQSDAPDIPLAAQDILGISVDAVACEEAEATLSADAWALDAMVAIGFCKAAKGDIEAAEADFTRLLEYTPDNYRALVGRALIAATRGERVQAERLFQDALNALPPIDESNRIVDAMAQL